MVQYMQPKEGRGGQRLIKNDIRRIDVECVPSVADEPTTDTGAQAVAAGKKEIRSFAISTVISMALAALLALVISLVFSYGEIPSESMYPSIEAGSYFIGSRIAYYPKRGDVISFIAPDEPDKYFCKRVIGIEGDTIEIKSGKVYRNGEPLTEEYAYGFTEPYENGSVFYVPKGCVLCMGDNREHSSDARVWKNPYVPVSTIIGKVLLVFNTHGIYRMT